jgi:hypothetical protein
MLGKDGLGVVRKTFGVVLLVIAVKLLMLMLKVCFSTFFFYKFTPNVACKYNLIF